jgi:hypothetical protein
LVGDDFFFIGADYPANSLRYVGQVITPGPHESPAELVGRLYREYLDSGRRLLYVGATVPVPGEQTRPFKLNGQKWNEILYVGNANGTTQPIFHIDMFISLAGRGPDGKYRVLVGDPGMASVLLNQPKYPHAMQEVFDNIARTLKRNGFEVIRNPLPLAYVDDPGARERTWYFATSNNALVQWSNTPDSTVFLPSYGHGNWASLSATDAANRKIWEKLGFKAVMLGDFHPFAENLGAVHCIKKYLARSS